MLFQLNAWMIAQLHLKRAHLQIQHESQVTLPVPVAQTDIRIWKIAYQNLTFCHC